MTQHTYSYNTQHLIRDGKPWLPAMGEFHFSRYPDTDWRESIRLMKTGGVDIVASYVIWLHHEPEQGEYDFTGSRNIRKFLDICAEEDMAVFLRIGPYVHGEVKHGGCPDWMGEVPGWRSTHPAFLACLRRYWTALYGEIKEHIGGCILGLQFDNEYIWGGEGLGDDYIDALVSLADDIGIRAPIHTATKCKGQFSGHCIPAFGSYADAPWSGSMTKLPPNACFLFSNVRDVDQLRETIRPEERGENWCTPEDLPFLCAEIGGGVQPTYDRRPTIHPRDVGALMTAKLGSGVVLPGVYMYHGGTNPGYGLQESRSFGDGTTVPELSYDFQAPIGEYGKTSGAYTELRRIFTFLRDYGEMLAPMPAVMPEDNPQNPNDLEQLRYCFRTNGKSGFVFVNNHIRDYETATHTRAFSVKTESGEVMFPEMTFVSGDYGFYPFNLPMGKGTLVSTNAQPLCKLNGRSYVFFTDREPVYIIEGDVSDTEIITITESDSRKASKVTVGGRDYLLICDADYTRDGDDLLFRVTADTSLRVYPAPDGREGFAEYMLTCPDHPVSVRTELISENVLMKEFSLTVDPAPNGASDLLLDVEYEGDTAELFLGGKKVADQFSLGNSWQIGLRRFSGATDFTLRIFSLAEGARVFMNQKPAFRNGFACELKNVTAAAEYTVRFQGLKG